MNHNLFYWGLAALASVLSLACSKADQSLGVDIDDNKTPPVTFTDFDVDLSARTEPMVWYGYYGLAPEDSIMPGSTIRQEPDSVYADMCQEESSWYSYYQYTPVYQTRADFEKRIVATADSVPLLNMGKLMVQGNYKYVTDVNRGVHIYDDTDPAHPKKVAFINIPGTLDIALKNHTLLANAYSALVAIDITTPTEAKLQSLLPNAFPPIYVGNAPIMDSVGNVAIAWRLDTIETCYGYYDYITGGAENTATDGKGSSSSTVLGQNASLSRFAISEQWLYTVDSYSMRLFDISNESAPAKGNIVNTTAWDLETIFRSDSVLYVGAMSGLYVYVHNGNSTAPTFASQFTHVTSCDPVVVQNGIAYVTLRSEGNRCNNGSNELIILDVQDPYKIDSIGGLALTNPRGLAIEDSTLFVCEGNYGLTVIDVKTPAQPHIVNQERGAQPDDVIANGGILTLIGTAGIWRYDYSDRENLVRLSYDEATPTTDTTDSIIYPEVMLTGD